MTTNITLESQIEQKRAAEEILNEEWFQSNDLVPSAKIILIKDSSTAPIEGARKKH